MGLRGDAVRWRAANEANKEQWEWMKWAASRREGWTQRGEGHLDMKSGYEAGVELG